MGCSYSTYDQVAPLHSTYKLGNLELPNRFIVAAATRLRAGMDGIPNDIMVKYYAQRASAGLIITESAAVSSDGNCYPIGGACYNDSHVAGWKKVTDAVHAKGGRIFI